MKRKMLMVLSFSLLMIFTSCSFEEKVVEVEAGTDSLLAPMAAEVTRLIESGGLESLLAASSLNTHEKIYSIKEEDLEAEGSPKGLKSLFVSRKALTEIPLEVYIWIPGFSGTAEKEEAIKLLSSFDIWGIGYPPCLENDNYQIIQITMNSGEIIDIDAYKEPDFPVVVIDRAENEITSSIEYVTKGTEITIYIKDLYAYWPKKLDPFLRPAPEFYCCTKPIDSDSWRINSGTHPWGDVNDSGQLYTINLDVLYHYEDLTFDIQFRDMDGLTPNPYKTIDDSIGALEIASVDIPFSSASAVWLHTDTDVTDDNSDTTITSSHTYFRIYKE